MHNCKCSCHKVKQIDAWPIGKMIFCDCEKPHADPSECNGIGGNLNE